MGSDGLRHDRDGAAVSCTATEPAAAASCAAWARSSPGPTCTGRSRRPDRATAVATYAARDADADLDLERARRGGDRARSPAVSAWILPPRPEGRVQRRRCGAVEDDREAVAPERDRVAAGLGDEVGHALRSSPQDPAQLLGAAGAQRRQPIGERR